MTNHPHRSKKAWTNVRVSAKDARDLALMLKLHEEACKERVTKCFDAVPFGAGKDHPEYDRTNAAIRSWARAARKARSFANQFEMIAIDAEGGMAVIDAVQLR